MTYEQAMATIGEAMPLRDAAPVLAAIRARLALAERVVEAAEVVVNGNHACVVKLEPYGCEFCDALRAALAAWKEGEP